MERASKGAAVKLEPGSQGKRRFPYSFFIVLNKTFDYFFVYYVVTLISAARPSRAYDKRYHDQIKLIIEKKIVVPSIGSFLL